MGVTHTMRLDQELVVRGLCESRTEAQQLIEAGCVVVNGVVAHKQTRHTIKNDHIKVTSRRQFVSRGGDKLLGVLLDVYGNPEASGEESTLLVRKQVDGKTALDVGSSTGGFTDCLLQYGAAFVDAVDVGTAQLHEKVRHDKRVTVFENTDIRNFSTYTTYDIIVADLSFIPLSYVFDSMLSFGASDTQYFLLIKPQFEVGKGNTKKGIVKDIKRVDAILENYKKSATEKGMKDVTIIPCRIQGGEGNQEFFLVGTL